MKLKLDENIPQSAASRLAALGYDVDTVTHDLDLYVAELIYQGERSGAMSADDEQALLKTDLAAVFREMEDGKYLEPSDDEFERAVHGWAQSYSTE